MCSDHFIANSMWSVVTLPLVTTIATLTIEKIIFVNKLKIQPVSHYSSRFGNERRWSNEQRNRSIFDEEDECVKIYECLLFPKIIKKNVSDIFHQLSSTANMLYYWTILKGSEAVLLYQLNPSNIGARQYFGRVLLCDFLLQLPLIFIRMMVSLKRTIFTASFHLECQIKPKFVALDVSRLFESHLFIFFYLFIYLFIRNAKWSISNSNSNTKSFIVPLPDLK